MINTKEQESGIQMEKSIRKIGVIVAVLLLTAITISAKEKKSNPQILINEEGPFSMIARNDKMKRASYQLQKFEIFYSLLNRLYIEEVDNEQLVEAAISSVLEELDPHSRYLNTEEMSRTKEEFAGKFSGIGVQIEILNDSLNVVNVIAGGPSEKVGIHPNDRIVRVDSMSIVGMPQVESVKRMRGEKGSYVNIEVVRRGVKNSIIFRVKRDEIAIESLDAAYLLTPTTGYIRITRFAHTTYEELTKAYQKIGKPKSLILDLRGNGGGLMDQAIEVANFFLPKGSLITSTEGRSEARREFIARKSPIFPTDGEIIVVLDEFSASASEIVAGAIQDWDRGVVVGRRSFGKGLVQRQVMLPDGSAVNITIAKYLTPSGRAIQRPFEKGKKSSYYENMVERFKRDYVDSLSSTGDTIQYKTLILGRTVYGGGGIYPDHYVKSDTVKISKYYMELIGKGVIADFVSQYLSEHRESLSTQFPTFEQYDALFEVDQTMIAQLVELGEKSGVGLDSEELDGSKSQIKKRVKALIASTLFSTSEAIRIFNADDKDILKALEVIHDLEQKQKIIIN